MERPPLNALQVFVSAARAKNMTRAAERAHLTVSALSHQVRTLEQRLGYTLFVRGPRGLTLTDEGARLLDRVAPHLDAIDAALRPMRARRDSVLSLSALPSMASSWLMPRLHRFFAAHPDVDVRISARTRLLNRGGQGDAVERATIEKWLEESDVAILYGHGDYPGYRVDKLLALTIAPMCSPQLVRGDNALRAPQDLRVQTLVHDDSGARYDGVAFWDVWISAAGVEGVDTSRGSHFSQPVLALEAASDALGVVATFPVLANAELAVGRLILPFELQVPLQSAYYLVSSDTALRPVVIAFRDWLLAEAAQQTAV